MQTDSIITPRDVMRNATIRQLIEAANRVLAAIGYTEHGARHCGFVSRTTANILQQLGYPERTVELAAITGWVHDVGNCINRKNHGLSGANILMPILREIGLPLDEVLLIVSAVGNHEEQNGKPVNEISAALIIADKSDAHRTRVRRGKYDLSDIHDRVNYSISKNWLEIDANERLIRYGMTMDDTSSIMDFLQIYMSRMVMSEEAAAFLGCRFEILCNGSVVNNRVGSLLP